MYSLWFQENQQSERDTLLSQQVEIRISLNKTNKNHLAVTYTPHTQPTSNITKQTYNTRYQPNINSWVQRMQLLL